MTAVLSRSQARELAELLVELQDWLTHADGQTHAELGEFLGRWSLVGNDGPYRVRWLIDRLGAHATDLTRQLTDARHASSGSRWSRP